VKAVVQRVRRAAVRVGGEITGEIERGLLVFVGVASGDGPDDAAWLTRKVSELRIFSDADGKFNLALDDVGGAVLVVSQFTLLGDARKGRRPAFTEAAPPEVAEPLVRQVVDLLRETGLRVAEGRFGAKMEVESVNDGPVTLILDSRL
jgi:D-tyrosyl-tRNA(Tyr) deacylase